MQRFKGGKRQSQRTSSLVIQFKRNLNVLYSRANGEILNKKSEYIYVYSLCVLFNSKDDIRSQGDDDGSSIQHLPRIIHTFIDSINSLFFINLLLSFFALAEGWRFRCCFFIIILLLLGINVVTAISNKELFGAPLKFLLFLGLVVVVVLGRRAVVIIIIIIMA